MTTLRPSHKIDRRSSIHQTNKIKANKTTRTIDRKATIETTTNNNGGQGKTTTPVQATTPTGTRLRASSAGN